MNAKSKSHNVRHGDAIPASNHPLAEAGSRIAVFDVSGNPDRLAPMRKTWRQRSLTCGRPSLCAEPIPTMLGRLAVVLIWLAAAVPACPASYYPQRLEDPRAVYVAGPSGGDDTTALQQAIDRVRETGGQGIVLLGPGRYRINDTLYIWPGIRVIGYGATRPVIVLSANTPGFQEPTHEKVMIFFAGDRKSVVSG